MLTLPSTGMPLAVKRRMIDVSFELIPFAFGCGLRSWMSLMDWTMLGEVAYRPHVTARGDGRVVATLSF
ncbi:MAG: hypothetical protein NVS1B11_34690 [Terriglobales bacterium]